MRPLLVAAQPIAAPYNAPSRLELPTPDGSGATIHPSVVDVGSSGWCGYRYWLADTPYAAGNNQLENPSIWASNNRTRWVVPAGVTNPLVAAPGAAVGFHSDTELVWDQDASRMILLYRLALSAAGKISSIELRALTSTDGATWTYAGKVADLPVSGSGRLSPAIVRTGVNQWRMWLWGDTLTATTLTATNPLGPWSAPTDTTLGAGALLGWHGDVIQHAGTFYMAYSGANLAEIKVARSADGIAWVEPATPTIITRSTTRWDRSVYRPTLVAGPEAGLMSVWYSAISAPSPGGYAIGFTRIPISAWG